MRHRAGSHSRSWCGCREPSVAAFLGSRCAVTYSVPGVTSPVLRFVRHFSRRTVAVVGESGCGKTTLAKAILGLEPVTRGSIEALGANVTNDLKGLAKRVGIVWQDPYASLDSRWRVGRSIEEPLIVNNASRNGRVDEVMKQVGLEPTLKSRFPHQLSEGKAAVAIARALAESAASPLRRRPLRSSCTFARRFSIAKGLQKEIGCAYCTYRTS